MPNRVLCDTCEGTGRVRPHPYDQSTMLCPAECHNGHWPADATALDGARVRHAGTIGYAFMWLGRLCLESEAGFVIILDPLTVEILPCAS